MPYGSLISGRDYEPTELLGEDGRPLSRILIEIDLGEDRIVPVGFLTDWGSIPKLADDLLGIDTRRGSLAYLTHDYNYRTGARSRKLSDLELRVDQTLEGVGRFERSIVYLALRVGGRRAYKAVGRQ